MEKTNIIKISSYSMFGFLLSILFFDLDAIEYIFNLKIEYVIIFFCIFVAGTVGVNASTKKLIYYFLIFLGSILVSTIINRNEIISALYYSFRILTCILLIDHYSKIEKLYEFLSGMKHFLSISIIITFVIQILNQDMFGYTISGNYRNFLVSDNFLGFDYISFLVIICILNQKKSIILQKIEFVFWSIICILSLSVAWSIGALLSTIIFFTLVLLISCNYNIRKKMSIKKALVYNILLFFCIVIIRVHTYFEWFIVGILHKSMTLSWRTYIWDATLENIWKSPLFGYGTCKGQLMEINSFYVNGIYFNYFSHNVFLEILIQGGIIALLTFLNIFRVVEMEYSKLEINKSKKLYAIICSAIFCMFLMAQFGNLILSPVFFLPLLLLYYS